MIGLYKAELVERKGAETTIGSFFLPGHDKTAESAVISLEYGGVPEFLVQHGYGPGGKARGGPMAGRRRCGAMMTARRGTRGSGTEAEPTGNDRAADYRSDLRRRTDTLLPRLTSGQIRVGPRR